MAKWLTYQCLVVQETLLISYLPQMPDEPDDVTVAVKLSVDGAENTERHLSGKKMKAQIHSIFRMAEDF